jgi:hypothetical protein
MWLPWNYAAVLTVVVAAVAWRARGWRRATAQELALVLGLYTLWRFAGALALRKVHGAEDHARALWHLEQWLHLPSELTVQRQVIHHPLVVQFLNGYYAIVHVPAMVAVLVWLFFWHRDRYAWVRNTLALLTATCLLLHFIPMAPPRLLPESGLVDTGLAYGQSVYGPGGAHGLSNQLAAIPSVHVGWALLGPQRLTEPVALAGRRPPRADHVGDRRHREPLVARRRGRCRAAAARGVGVSRARTAR